MAEDDFTAASASEVPAEGSDMRDLLNPNYSQFSYNVTHAAKHGKLKNAEPLLRTLDGAYKAALGVEVILRLLETNGVLATDKSEDAPLSNFQTGALTGLAIFAMQALISDIEGTANMADKYSVPAEPSHC